MATAIPVILVLLLVMVAGCWFTLYQLVRQQGRILIRLDEIEARVAGALDDAASGARSNAARDVERSAAGGANGATVHEHNGASSHDANGDANVAASNAAAPHDAYSYAVEAPREPDRGIPVGEVVPDFRLRDVTGRSHTLSSHRGRRVLLVHWGTTCGFCDMMAPELSALQPALDEHGVDLVLVSYGEPEDNIRMASEYGFDCPVLLQPRGVTIEAFMTFGTPVAYLVDEEGRVAEPLAIGAEQVPELARRAAGERARLPGEKSLSESRIERDGLPAGTPAPTFTLPDIHGRTVSLESYRGRRVLLVFSDPNCGPCDELAPHLARVHREHRDNNLAIVMVGRGDLTENQRKAAELGLEFPVVMQEKWKLSKEYGIFATPVGFLIGEDGIIQHDVAMGGSAILSLVDEH